MDEYKKILVVGDVMFDRYFYVSSTRKAPEADIPVWDEKNREVRLGGAANVASNISSLARDDDYEIFLAGIMSPEDKKRFRNLAIDTILSTGSSSMYKDRFVNEKMEYVFRHDNFKKFLEEDVSIFKKSLNHFCNGHSFDAVIFSDYDKGTIDEELVSIVDKYTNEYTLTVVDSKRLDLSIFKGANVLKINDSEYSAQVSKAPYKNVEALFDNVVVTKGAKGAELRIATTHAYNRKKDETIFENDKRYIVMSEMFPTISVTAKDVTGCGDTHTAAMAFSMLKRNDVRMSIKFANECARQVVQKFGTSVIE